ncbi:MAG: helix-turn-helix domain-containing protein [Pseudomonadota bacterium]
MYDLPRPGAEPKLNGKQEAQVIAVACSDPPAGHEHWTLRLLADRIVELEFAESYSYEAVRRTLKNAIKPWQKEEWCIPKVSAEYVANRGRAGRV